MWYLVITMKQRNTFLCATLLGMMALSGAAFGQQRQGNRLFNPFAVQFRRVWDVQLPDPVKLIEVGPVTGEKGNSVVMLVGGQDKNDYKRKLLITHWDNLARRFFTDYSMELPGTEPDALLLGRFRIPKPAPNVKPAKGKPALPTKQIVTTVGVYEWTENRLSQIFNAPASLKLALVMERATDQLLSGMGDGAQLYEIGDVEVRPVPSFEFPQDGSGYVRFGAGMQDYPGAENLEFAPGIRYVQSCWNRNNKWLVGLIRGQSAGNPDAPRATIGDRLVVYTPKFASREKSFWETRVSEDLEVSWTGEKLSGRVLDVRIGDPNNEGRDGILVLTAENNDKVIRLLYYEVDNGLGRR